MRKLILVCFVSLFSVSSLAALDLELTQGVDGALPIAIVPFGGESLLGSNELTNVIATDLRNSGHFNIVDAKKGHESPFEFSQISIKKWRKLGLDTLVVGSVTKKANNKFSVSFQLANLYASKSQEKTGSVLLNKSYTLNKDSMRALGHHIADDIFHKLLGKKGVFSTHIAYVLVQKNGKKHTQYHLMVSDIDGANQQALVTSFEPVMSPAWSPDGRRIAYVSFEGHKAAIYLQAVLSGRRQKIASFPGINGAPAWAPDGQHLALVLSKTGYPKIYILNLKTKKLTQLTDGWAIDTEPSFSPDGQSIIFTSNRGGGPQIYQVPVNGGRAERITFSGPYNATASLTKDGSALVLLHKENSEYHIAVQDMSSGQLEILTDSGKNQSPSLAPNDEMVVFATKLGRKQVLGMVSRDARIRLRLPAGDGDVREPAWSPT